MSELSRHGRGFGRAGVGGLIRWSEQGLWQGSDLPLWRTARSADRATPEPRNAWGRCSRGITGVGEQLVSRVLKCVWHVLHVRHTALAILEPWCP